MNLNSLAYDYAKNQQLQQQLQQEQSWKDNPFELKEGFFDTGVSRLSHQQELDNYALELVASYGEFIGDQYELDLEKISAPYQLELVRLYIESIDREIEWACYGSDSSLNSEFLCAMLAMLKDDNEETREKFAQVTSYNILVYYKKQLQEILDNACVAYYTYSIDEFGQRANYEADERDEEWRR